MSYIDPLDRTTTSTYDGNGNLLRIDRPEVNGEVPQTHFTYNTRGQVETRTDAEGRLTSYTYDGSSGDQLTVATDPGGLNLATAMAYDAVGNMTAKTNPRGHTTAFQYDAMRRLTQMTAPPPLGYVTKYAYDADGNLTSTQRQTGDSLEPWQTVTSTYTLSGKKQTVTDPQGHVTTYQYDEFDRLWRITDADGQTTEYVYDDVGRLYRVIDALANISEEHGYTSNGLQESLTDANGNTTTYGYDDFDFLENTTYPDTSFEAFSYDAIGNPTQKRTRAGQFIDYMYDNLDRMETKAVPGSDTIQYTYDLTGLLVDVADSTGAIHHDYDNARRLVRVMYRDGKTVEYAYDEASKRTRLTYPDGCYLTYDYDELGRLTDIYEQGASVLAHYEYDALSRRTMLTYANGTSAVYEYEIDDDLTSLTHQFATESVHLSYTYDNVGNRTGFGVDDERFLYTPPASFNIAYVTNNLNQYNSVNDVTLRYDDGNGNLTSDGVNEYTYDAENRLTAVSTPEHPNITYAHDPMGRRFAKTVDGTTTEYVYAADQVIAEYQAGTLSATYLYGPGIDEPIAMTTTGGTYYYAFDGLGSVTALTDDDGGNLVESYSYDVYGQPSITKSAGSPYLFTGRRFDDETDLYYYRARYYDSYLGRFLQPDPSGYIDSLNLYTYVNNNPINWVDPYGLCETKPLKGLSETDLIVQLKKADMEGDESRVRNIINELVRRNAGNPFKKMIIGVKAMLTYRFAWLNAVFYPYDTADAITDLNTGKGLPQKVKEIIKEKIGEIEYGLAEKFGEFEKEFISRLLSGRL